MEFTIDQEVDFALLAAPKIDPKTLVAPGPRGVSNFQMIPVMKAAVDAGDINKLVLLKQYFPLVFISTTKYIGKERKTKLDAMAI